MYVEWPKQMQEMGGLFIKEHTRVVRILKTYGCNVKNYKKDSTVTPVNYMISNIQNSKPHSGPHILQAHTYVIDEMTP